MEDYFGLKFSTEIPWAQPEAIDHQEGQERGCMAWQLELVLGRCWAHMGFAFQRQGGNFNGHFFKEYIN